jgi:hypothetical protein
MTPQRRPREWGAAADLHPTRPVGGGHGMENPKGNRTDQPTAILCYGGGRAQPLAFDLDAVARFRAFLRLAATPDGREILRSDPEWAGYMRLDTLARFVDHQEAGDP